MFEDREQAGELLAEELKSKGYGGENSIVIAIPRGGVVTGRAVAQKLNLPLDIVVTRKIPAPNQPELALGAVGPGGMRVIDIPLTGKMGVSNEYLQNKIRELRKEVEERGKKFRFKRGSLVNLIEGKIVLLVDDGVATGATIQVAVRYLKGLKPKKIIIATPVISSGTFSELKELVDDIVAIAIPQDFYAVGQFYKEFKQVGDDEVISLLKN